MSYFEKNLRIIKKKNPRLYEAIKEWNNATQVNCSIVEAKNGSPIICVEKEKKEYYMGSRYNPEKEAERFAKQYESLVDYSYIIFVGLGSGVLAEQVIKANGANVQYLFYEPSTDIFLCALQNYDMAYVLDHDNVNIIVKGMNDQTLDIDIGRCITVENYKWCILDAMPLYKQLFEESYELVRQKYSFLVTMVGSNIATNSYFGRNEARNNILNMKELFHSNCEEDFEGVFPTDRPAIIVAAGPSLEKNVQHLKKAKGKLLIIAVDTALRYLLSQDIQPDLVAVADPKKPVQLFENKETHRIPMAFCGSANNDIVKLMKDTKVILASAEGEYFDQMYQIAGKHMYVLSAGGSVATFAFVLARAWGYHEIILVGQDLALSNNKVHAGKDDIDTFKLSRDKIEIEGYYGEKVYTSPDYSFYREWYEAVLAQKIDGEELKVINATEGGAKIEGTIQMPLQEAIESVRVEPFDFEKTIKEMPCTFNEQQQEKVIQMWKDSVAHMNQLRYKLQRGIRLIDQGIQMIKIHTYTVSKIKKIQKEIGKIAEECNNFDEIIFVDYYISPEHGDVLGDVLSIKEDNVEECIRMFSKMRGYMESMYDATKDIENLFKELLDDKENIKQWANE